MADIKALKSYLVSLGFSVNQTQLNTFNIAITTASQAVKNATSSMMETMLKWEKTTVDTFMTVGKLVISTADKIAQADQDYRLWGERMFMDATHARILKQALDSLGYSLGQIAQDPELRGRLGEIVGLLGRLEAMQPGGTEGALQGIRSIRVEWLKFQLEMQYLLRITIGKVFEALGGEKFIDRLKAINEYIVEHIPYWSDLFAKYIVPILKMMGLILGDVWRIGKDIAELFTNFVGIFTMDSTLMGAVNLEKFAHALEKVALLLGWVIRQVLVFIGTITGTLAGGAAGAGLGGILGAIAGGIAGIPLGPAGILTGIAAGGGLGSLVGGLGGGAIGGAAGFGFDTYRSIRDHFGGNGIPGIAGIGGIADNATLDQVTHAVMMQESGGHQFNRYGGILTSRTGAQGIMQLMPATARRFGVNPYDAAQNLAGGRAYLNWLHNRYGNWNDAVAGYFTGEGNIDRYKRMGRSYPSDVQGYMQSVAGHMGVTIGQINIVQPNLNHEQVASAVAEGVRRESALTTLQQMQQMRSVYG